MKHLPQYILTRTNGPNSSGPKLLGIKITINNGMTGAREAIRILHVDDEPSFALMVADRLAREHDGFEIVTESSPTDGLDRLQTAEFDCVVSDYQMPEMDGLAFLNIVRENYGDIPFILFTGKGSEEIASEAITAGVTDYLRKASGVERYSMLANRILNAVERYHALRQIDLSRRALATANEGISLVELDGTFSYVNPAFAALFGYEPEELIGEHWKILYHNQEARRLENDILPAVSAHGYWSGETVRLTNDGRRLITDHRLAKTGGDAIVCTAQDVTPERMNMTDLRDEFDLLFDSLEGQAFYTLDHEGYITRWNEGAKRLNGYEASEILGEHISVFFTEEDRNAGRPEHLIETAKVNGSVNVTGWRLRKDGTRFWADVTFSASYDDAGTLRGFGSVTKESTRVVSPQVPRE